MTSNGRRTDDESVPKTSRYLRTVNLVVQFVTNVVKLAMMLAS